MRKGARAKRDRQQRALEYNAQRYAAVVKQIEVSSSQDLIRLRSSLEVELKSLRDALGLSRASID